MYSQEYINRGDNKQNVDFLRHQQAWESNAVSYPRRLPIAIESASGPYIYDVEGNRYIDFLTGAGVLPLGHNNSVLKRAAKEQIDVFYHGLDFPTSAKNRFIEAHLSMLPESMQGHYKVQLCAPTGADAVEAAIKLCKLKRNAEDVISFHGGYHGCTHGALGVTSARDMKEPFGNIMAGVHFLPYSYCFRCPLGLKPQTCSNNCGIYANQVLTDTHNGMRKVAAIILELVQGEGGVIPAQKPFIQSLVAAAKAHNIPVIVDEIQTGCGRTGTWFAFEQYDFEPDVIVCSKAVSGIGAPAAMILLRKEMDCWKPGQHIGTFRGHQLAFATGAAFVEYCKKHNLLSNVQMQGRRIITALEEFSTKYTFIGDVRGRGLMLGMEIVDPNSGEPSTLIASMIQKAALKSGLILEVGGRHDSVVRMLPPLNVRQDVVANALSILSKVLNSVGSEYNDYSTRRIAGDYQI